MQTRFNTIQSQETPLGVECLSLSLSFRFKGGMVRKVDFFFSSVLLLEPRNDTPTRRGRLLSGNGSVPFFFHPSHEVFFFSNSLPSAVSNARSDRSRPRRRQVEQGWHSFAGRLALVGVLRRRFTGRALHQRLTRDATNATRRDDGVDLGNRQLGRLAEPTRTPLGAIFIQV